MLVATLQPTGRLDEESRTALIFPFLSTLFFLYLAPRKMEIKKGRGKPQQNTIVAIRLPEGISILFFSALPIFWRQNGNTLESLK